MQSKKNTIPQFHKKRAFGIDYLESTGDEGAPVILLFHGFGADHEDLASLSACYTGKRRPTWILPNGPDLIPIGAFGMGRSWFPIDVNLLERALQEKKYTEIQKAFPEEIRLIREKVEGFIAELGVAPHNLILGGFSQGAVLATELALHAFERPLGLLIFSGTLVNQESWQKLAAQKGGLSFFQSHGTDDPLLPLILAEQLEKLLISAGCEGKLYSFNGGHEIPRAVLHKLDLFLQKLIP